MTRSSHARRTVLAVLFAASLTASIAVGPALAGGPGVAQVDGHGAETVGVSAVDDGPWTAASQQGNDSTGGGSGTQTADGSTGTQGQSSNQSDGTDDSSSNRTDGTDDSSTGQSGESTTDTNSTSTPDGGSVGTASTTVSPAAVGSGQTLRFNGASYAIAADSRAIDIAGQASIEFWIKPDGTSDADASILQRENAYNVSLVGSGDVRRVRWNGQFSQQSLTSEAGLPANVWTHVAITYDGNRFNMYINGELDGSVDEGKSVQRNRNDLVLGANAALNDRFFSGEIDNLRLWNRSRTLIEIRSDYQSELDGSQTDLEALYQSDTAPAGGPVSNLGQETGGDLALTGASLTDYDALPVAPDVHVTETSNGSVTVEWDDRSRSYAPTVATHRVYRTGPGGTTQVASGSDPGGSYVDTGVTNGATYHYRVEFEDANRVRGDRSKPAEARPFGGVSSTTETPDGGGNGALELGGSGLSGYGTVPDQPPTDISGQATIEFWIKHDGTSDPDASILQKKGAYNVQLAGRGEERRIRWAGQFSQQSLTSDAGVPANVWTHVAITYDGNAFNMYINGKLDGSVDEGKPFVTSNNRLVLGANDARNARFLHGKIDNLRLWDVARTADQIEENYSEQLPGRSAGLAGLWQFDDVGNTNRAYGSTFRHNNVSLTGDAALVEGGASLTPPHTYAVSGNGSATVRWDSRETFDGSIDVWRSTDPSTGYTRIASGLEEGANYTDTGRTNGQTYYYATTFVAPDGRESDFSKPATATPYADAGGASLELDGQSSANVSDRDSLDVSGEATFEFWLKHDGTSDADARVIQKQNAYHIRLVGSGEDRRIMWDGQFSQRSITSRTAVPAGEWTHVAVTYDGTQFNLYINGELDNSASGSKPVQTSNNELRIGSNGAGNDQFLSGRVDELRIWDVARTAEQIENNYRSELVGNETGLDAYWRFDDPSTTVARGSDETHGDAVLEVNAEVSATGALPVQPRVYARGDDANVSVAWQSRDDAPQTTTVSRAGSPDLVGLTELGTRDADLAATLTDGGVTNGNAYYYTATTTDDDGQTSDRAAYASALPSAADRPLGNALEFDDNASSASVSPRASTKLDGTTGTVEAWVKFDADAQEDAIVMERGGGDTWELYLSGTGAERRFSFYGGFSTGGVTAPVSASVTAGQWNHVAVTRNGQGDYTMYVNGDIVATSSDPSGFENGGDAPLSIGSNVANNDRLFNGEIDELRLWNDHRSAGQIQGAYDRELTGFEPGLVGYWRGCSDPSDSSSTRGAARKPMTLSTTNVRCVDSTVDGQSGGGATTNATVILEGAPDGLAGYRIRLNATDSVVTSVTPSLIDGDEFGIQAGGPGQTAVTASAGEVLTDSGTFTDNRTLFYAEFAGNVSRSDLQVTVERLLDDTGSPMSSSRVTVTLGTTQPGGSPFSSPFPGAVGSNPPTDTNGDGEIEDLDGDGTEGFLDVVTFLFALGDLGGLTDAQKDAIDYDGSGSIGFLDVVDMLFGI
jgi:hypothetical protein